MLFQCARIFGFLVCLLMALPDTADARGFRMPRFRTHSSHSVRVVPVVIPGGDKVVFVRELPDAKIFTFRPEPGEDGKPEHFDLGYKFNMFSGGEWVGYFRMSRRYIELDQDKLKPILDIIGVTGADIPARSASQGFAMLISWLFAGVCLLGFVLLKMPSVPRLFRAGGSYSSTANAGDVSLERALADMQTGNAGGVRYAENARTRVQSPRGAASSTGQTSRPSFGRRA